MVWLFAGAVFFTLRMGFINVRGFWHAVRLTKGDYDDPKDTGEVSHFQALSSALSATVGFRKHRRRRHRDWNRRPGCDVLDDCDRSLGHEHQVH